MSTRSSDNRSNSADGSGRNDRFQSSDGRIRLMSVVIVGLFLVLWTVQVYLSRYPVAAVGGASTTKGVNAHHLTHNNRYLLHFSQAGWANQVMCLKNAYVMAYILNRILLLPPVLPHRNEPGSTRGGMVLGPKGRGFLHQDTDQTDPFYHYLHRLPPDRYLPLSHVLDIPLSLPGVQTMDVRDFYQTYYHHSNSSMTKATIELDLDFSHFNTVWLYNTASELEGRINFVERFEYGRLQSLNQTYRDLGRTLGSQTEDILVFLDSFRSDMHETLLVQLPPWQPIMTPFVRQTIRTAVADWPPYAAIHLRAGDGPFTLRIDETIRLALQGISVVILEWLTNNIAHPPPSTIGLYIATDLESVRSHKLFVAEIANLTTVLAEQHHVNLTLLSLSDLGNTTIGGIATTAPATPLSLLGGMLYEDIFCDIQVAVCAPIGFYGSAGSSLSELIERHRSRSVADHAC